MKNKRPGQSKNEYRIEMLGLKMNRKIKRCVGRVGRPFFYPSWEIISTAAATSCLLMSDFITLELFFCCQKITKKALMVY